MRKSSNICEKVELKQVQIKRDPWGEKVKVYNDGRHFICTHTHHSQRGHIIYFSERKKEINRCFKELYVTAVRDNLKGEELKEFIKTGLLDKLGFIENIDNLLDKKIKDAIHSFYVRLKRFNRKVNLNVWNYFTTFTFDSKKMCEEEFRKKLRKCLANLHTRHGWRYMGVFELSPEEHRLHFHALMYIPKGEMVGEIFEERSYSTKKKAMQVAHINTFFQKKFGRCDFAKITKEDLKYGNTASYITKYLNKTREKIVYSRAIPSEINFYVEDKDIAVEFTDFVCKYVLFDDVLNSEDIYTLAYPTRYEQCKFKLCS